MSIQTKRIYEPPAESDGPRFLVDRLWPRGVKKESLHVQEWVKDAAPSDALRQWFHHDVARWDEFRRRYFMELDHDPEVVKPILEAAAKGPVTLVFTSKDTERNNAVALREYLAARLPGKPAKVKKPAKAKTAAKR